MTTLVPENHHGFARIWHSGWTNVVSRSMNILTKKDPKNILKSGDVNIIQVILHQKIPNIHVLINGNTARKVKNAYQEIGETQIGHVSKINALVKIGISAQSLKSVFQKPGSVMGQSNVQ